VIEEETPSFSSEGVKALYEMAHEPQGEFTFNPDAHEVKYMRKGDPGWYILDIASGERLVAISKEQAEALRG
jgi:hypothetical protein